MTLVFHQKAGPGRQHIVFQVSHQIRTLLLSLSDIKVGLRVVSAENYILVTRCFKCCGYGHRANTCTHNQSRSHCAENHSFRYCQYFQTRRDPICVNCASDNRRLGGNLPTKHSAFDSVCPALKRYLQVENKRIEWSQGSNGNRR